MFRQSERQRLAVYGKNPHHGCHLETARPEYRGVCRGGDSSSSDQSTCPFSLTRGHLTWRGGLNDYEKTMWFNAPRFMSNLGSGQALLRAGSLHLFVVFR